MIKDFTLYSEPIKKIFQQLELEQKEKDSVDYEKISPCTQLVKDEFKEILKLSKKNLFWESFCYNDLQFQYLKKLCDASNISYNYSFTYYDNEPERLDYIRLYKK